MDIRKKYLIGKSGIALEQVVALPSLEVLQDCGGVALRDMVSGHSGDGLLAGLGNLSGRGTRASAGSPAQFPGKPGGRG